MRVPSRSDPDFNGAVHFSTGFTSDPRSSAYPPDPLLHIFNGLQHDIKKFLNVFLIKTGRDATTQSTQTAGAAIELAQAETQTQAAYVPPSNTPPPTSTQVPPTSTPPPTATQVPVEDGSGGGPTPDPRTATVQALLTQAALAQTQAAQQLLTQTSTPTATGLPDTGIADDLGNISPQVMLGMAGLLILVIFIARRLRASTG